MSIISSVKMKRAKITSDCGISASMCGFAVVLFLTSELALSSASNFTYIGCYERKDISAYNHGSVTHPFSWEVCLNLCLVKMTVFAGMSSYSKECFCCNETPKWLPSTEDSQCDRCQEDRSRHCGGLTTVSLYQLTISNAFPTAVLIATENGVNISVLGYTSQSKTLIPFKDGPSAVGYHYDNQQIYLSSGNKIFKCVYVSRICKYSDPALFVEIDCTITGFIIDWVRNLMFFSCDEKVYKVVLSSHTYYFHMLGSSNFHLVLRPREITWYSIAYMSKAVYSGIDDLIYHQLTGLQPSVLDFHKEKYYYINDTSINVRELRDTFSQYYYRSYELFSGSDLSYSSSLDVADETAVWVTNNTNTSAYTLYKAEITESGLENVTVVWTGDQQINDIKIYHSAVQIPSKRYMCEKKNCSHTCSLVYRVARCGCPEEMNLGPDSRSCSLSGPSTDPTPTELTVSEEEVKPHHQYKHIVILYTGVVTCFIVLLIVVSFQIYLISKQKKNSSEYDFHYNKRSGQAELTRSS